MNKFGSRVTAAVAAAVLAFAPVCSAHAEGENAGEAQADTEELTFEEQRQASYDVIPDTNEIEGWPQGPQIYGHSGIVMDMDSGAVLYEKAADDQHYPASITKIMTALVALENAELDAEINFSQASVDFLEYGDASIGMTPGEILSLNDAMYGMLLASANEVSYAIAESVGTLMGGGYDTFIQEMNDRAAELGCTGSHWVNPNGLHDEQHYTTARDMALITSALYEYEEYKTVTQTLNYTIGPTNLVNESRTFQQNHKMLWPDNYYYYEYCTGGKTGYTDQSRTTLVTTAENNGLRLVAVILQDDGDVYVDTRSMFDYAFGNFSKALLSDQEKPEGVKSYASEDAYVLLPSGVEFSSLDQEITISDEKSAAGTVTYYYEGQNVGSADVTLTAGYVEEMTGYSADPKISGEGGSGEAEASAASFPVGLLLGTAAVIAVLFAAALILIRYQAVKRRRRRRQAARRRAAASRANVHPSRPYMQEGRRPSPERTRPRQYRSEHRDRDGRYR